MINASSKIRLYINGKEYTDFLIEGSLSDDSAYSSNIITTKGTIILGGDTSILDFKKTKFPIGSVVTVYATLRNDKLSKLPRGHLYVLNSSVNVNERLTTLEVGCSLAFLASREANYEDDIQDLIEGCFSTSFKECFVVEDYNLSTLDALLKTDGKCIFQDKHGYVQTINQFGNDGYGANVRAPKLTCFDKETAINVETLEGAIEDLPSAVKIEESFEISNKIGGTDPEPFVTSELTRTVDYTDAEKSTFYIINDKGGSAGTEAIPGCGTVYEPDAPAPPKYAYTAKGAVFTKEKQRTERVVTGSYSSYLGPGRQVDWEYDWEWCSAVTYAGDILSTVVNKYIEFALEEKEKANGLLSKANQFFDRADQELTKEISATWPSGNEKSEAQIAYEEEKKQKAYEYFTCLGTQLYDAAEDILGRSAFAASGMATKATTFADSRAKQYGISRITSTRYKYGEGDVLIKKIEKNYVHAASTQAAIKNTENLKAVYRGNANLSGYRFEYIQGINFAGYDAGSFDETLEGSPLPTSHSDNFKKPEKHYNQVLVSKTTTTYTYGTNFTTEKVVFEDFEDPTNNTSRLNYSSSGSRNADETDRIVKQRDANGCLIVNGEDIVEKVITATVPVKVEEQIYPAGWLGKPTATVKEISIPAEFAPIADKNCNGTVTAANAAETLNTYKQIILKYARNEALRIAGDNFGFRITEAATRAEIFGYYPFYPITLSLTSLGKRYKLRAATVNFVFDSSNVLCSFDCFNVGEIQNIPGSTEPSPYSFTDTSNVGTSTTVVLDSSFFNLPENAASITITSLSSGASFAVSGAALSVGDTVTVANINAGNVTATTDGQTTDIFVSYEVIKTNGDEWSGIDDIFPPDTVDYIGNVFADGGDFTANTSNGGFDANAGGFDTPTNGSGVNLDAGDFDTGETVVPGEPIPPSSASGSNNSVDPETEMGVGVVDEDDNNVSVGNISSPSGDADSVLETTFNVELDLQIKIDLEVTIEPQKGWDYGYIEIYSGTDIDMGTVAVPNAFVMDFGTVYSANEPVLASGVV